MHKQTIINSFEPLVKNAYATKEERIAALDELIDYFAKREFMGTCLFPISLVEKYMERFGKRELRMRLKEFHIYFLRYAQEEEVLFVYGRPIMFESLKAILIKRLHTKMQREKLPTLTVPLRYFKHTEFLTYAQFITLRDYVNQLNLSLYFYNTKNLILIQRENKQHITDSERKLIVKHRFTHILAVYRLYGRTYLQHLLPHLKSHMFVSREDFSQYFPTSFSDIEVALLLLIHGERIYLTVDGIFNGYTSNLAHMNQTDQTLIEGLRTIYRIDSYGGEVLETQTKSFFGKGGYYTFLHSMKYTSLLKALRIKLGQRLKHYVHFLEFDKELFHQEMQLLSTLAEKLLSHSDKQLLLDSHTLTTFFQRHAKESIIFQYFEEEYVNSGLQFALFLLRTMYPQAEFTQISDYIKIYSFGTFVSTLTDEEEKGEFFAIN